MPSRATSPATSSTGWTGFRPAKSCSWPETTISRSRPGACRTGSGVTTSRTTGSSFWTADASKFAAIPADIDIVVAHGPPRGHGDRTSGHAHVGSPTMTATLERVQPPLMVCGHIHEAYGRYRLGETEILNASLVDDRYRPVNRRLVPGGRASFSGSS